MSAYARDYDFSRPFFEQFRDLMSVMPRQSVNQNNVENAEYTNYALNIKNSYLSYSILYGSEDVYYSKNVERSRNIFDSFGVVDSEQCYETIEGYKNYNCSFVMFSHDCLDSSLLYDCVNCRNCFLCVGLRNKEYCIENKQYTKQEYLEKMKEYNRGSYKNTEQSFEALMELRLTKPHRYARLIQSKDSTGDDLKNASDAKRAFSSLNIEHVKDAFRCVGTKESRDVNHAGSAEYLYEFSNRGAEKSSRIFFCSTIVNNSSDIQYSDSCTGSSYLFGCVGLRNKSYCILNKQYSKEDYEALMPRIIEQMKNTAEYGEFFPPELSPFCYNETIAQEYFPLTKEQALAKGYRWKESETKHYSITKKPEDLPDHIKDINESILEEVIGCQHNQSCTDQCTQAFKIIPQELQFYRRMHLPLPRLCPNCRHYARLKQRNPLKLWHRKCANCPNEFETSYAPDRPEIVYCEQCYQQEVI